MTAEFLKQCFDCREWLPRSEFYAHAGTPDGLRGNCKRCKRRDVRAYYAAKRNDPSFIEAERRRGREKHERLYSVGSNWTSPPASEETKRRANHALTNAVRDGRIVKPRHCSECGRAGCMHGHHSDYSKPLQVEWLCSSCHRRRHATHPERVRPSLAAESA